MTGQYPRRRETEQQKRRRDEDAQVAEEERLKRARPMAAAEVAFLRPTIGSGGRLKSAGR